VSGCRSFCEAFQVDGRAADRSHALAGDSQTTALVFDLEVPPPPLPPPLPLRALRRPGAAALEREAKRVAQESAAAAAPRNVDMGHPTELPAQQRFGFAKLDLPAGFVSYAGARRSGCSNREAVQEMPPASQLQRRCGLARLGLSAKAAQKDDRSTNNSSSSMSPPNVPIQRCAQPRTQMLRSDSLT